MSFYSATRSERVRAVLTASSTNASGKKPQLPNVITIDHISDSKYRACTGEVYHSAKLPFPKRDSSKLLESSSKSEPLGINSSTLIYDLKDLDSGAIE